MDRHWERLDLEEALHGRRFKFPVDMFAWPNRGIAVVEKKGYITLQSGTGLPQLVLNLINDVSNAGSEEGLLSVTLDPRFDEFPYMYAYYTVSGDKHLTRLSRFDVVQGEALRDSEFVILDIPQPADIHNGGKILFGPDMMLYLSFGDGGPVWEKQSQRMDTLLGSIIRIDVRGTTEDQPYRIPEDNPLLSLRNARPEIWAWGFRNPWRMAFDPRGDRIWVGDVGWAEVEEITLVEAGTNHGWHLFEGSQCRVTSETGVSEDDCEDARDEMIFPIHEYLHDGTGCAVVGGYVYEGKSIPWLQGAYIFGDHCSAKIWALTGDEDVGWEVSEILRLDPHRRISSFGIDDEGEIYVLAVESPILKLVDIGGETE